MQADDVPHLEDLGMVLQLLTEDVAEDILVGLVSYLQTGAEIWTEERRVRGSVFCTPGQIQNPPSEEGLDLHVSHPPWDMMAELD